MMTISISTSSNLRWEANHMRAGAYTLHRHECMALTTRNGCPLQGRGTAGGWSGWVRHYPLPSSSRSGEKKADEAAPARSRPPKRTPGRGSQPSWNPRSGPGISAAHMARWAMAASARVAARRRADRAPPAARGPCSSAWEDVGPSVRSLVRCSVPLGIRHQRHVLVGQPAH